MAVSCLQESEITIIDLAIMVDSETGLGAGCAPRRCRLLVRCWSSSSSSSTRLLPYEEEMMDLSLRLNEEGHEGAAAVELKDNKPLNEDGHSGDFR